MTYLPDNVVQGEPARLFHVGAEGGRERRITSMFLSAMAIFPQIGARMLDSIGIRYGKRTIIEAFTEVVFEEGADLGCRPDGLIVVRNGGRSQTILVEAKTGRTQLEAAQIAKYLELARLNDVDMVLTISNEFTARPDHYPVSLSTESLQQAALFHWNWPSIATEIEMLVSDGTIEDQYALAVVRELMRFMAHQNSGIERFTQMPESWRDTLQRISDNDILRKSDTGVNNVVSAWFSQSEDLALELSRLAGHRAAVRIERKLLRSPRERLNAGIEELCDYHRLGSVIRIPGAAGDIEIVADCAKRTIQTSVRLEAPQDIQGTAGRMSWLLSQLQRKPDELIIRALWPGRRTATQRDLASLRRKPSLIDPDDSDDAPKAFELIRIDSGPKRFSGRRTFVEDLSGAVSGFWTEIVFDLKRWIPPEVVYENPGRSRPPGEATAFILGYLDGATFSMNDEKMRVALATMGDDHGQYHTRALPELAHYSAYLSAFSASDVRGTHMAEIEHGLTLRGLVEKDVIDHYSGFCRGLLAAGDIRANIGEVRGRLTGEVLVSDPGLGMLSAALNKPAGSDLRDTIDAIRDLSGVAVCA